VKKILGILGSPRKGGNSETLVERVLGCAGDRGAMTDVIRLQGLKLSGCIDCRKCWSRGSPCVIDDDMGKVHERIREADVLVFASPLYWYTWSSQMKPVWDRFLPFLHDEAGWDLKGKKAVLVATAGDDKPDAFDGMAFSFRTSCELLGLDHMEPLLAHGVYEVGDVKRGKWLEMAEELGRSL
jgi:multimeric flavodoxin WrbA